MTGSSFTCRLGLTLLAGLALNAHAQEVTPVTLQSVPPDLIQADSAGSPAAPEVDLGQNAGMPAVESPLPAPVPAAIPQAGTATRAAAMAARKQVRKPASAPGTGIERAVFDRQPVRVPLPVERERLITLPAPAALHVPSDMAQVARIEVIDKTMYVTALTPFTPIRIVAELIDSGQQIPMDLVAGKDTANATAELEVWVLEGSRAPVQAAVGGDAEADKTQPAAAADMVELTRHAARMVYAPRRLAWSQPGVQQVAVGATPLEGLLRGAHVEAAPLGQWRSGQLYVTAVRITNLSRQPLEIPLEDVRGRWIAATAQHGRIGPAGSDTDTTAIYLVCDRSFAACLN